MLRELDRNIWVAEQPLRYFGLSVGTRMSVIRLPDQSLAVISPIELNQPLIDQLNELGTIGHIVAPNCYHYFFASDFKAHYPQATFWAAPGLKEKVPSLPVDTVIKAHNKPAGLETLLFKGFRTIGSGGVESLNECVFFHAKSRTLILTDTAFLFDESFPFLTQFATRITGSYKALAPTLLELLATTDRKNARASIEKILQWDFERVIMAHGTVIEHHGKEKLKAGYAFLLKPRR